jgi:hypothetical protein
MKKVLVAISSCVGGMALVVAGIRFSFLSWVVEIPGLLVRQVLPINFHEGEGAFGFFVAILLSWLLSSIAVWFVVLLVRQILVRSRSHGSTSE